MKHFVLVRALQGRQKGDTVQNPGMTDPVVLDCTPLCFVSFMAPSLEEAWQSEARRMASKGEVVVPLAATRMKKTTTSHISGTYPKGMPEAWSSDPDIRWLHDEVARCGHTTRKVK